jgi:4-carboxymuconolactone decarboxylase
MAAAVTATPLLSGATHTEAKNMSYPALTMENVRAVSPALEKYTLNAVMSGLWKRPDLSHRDRSIITLPALLTRAQTI